MSRGIALLLQTKTQLVETGFRLSCDDHIGLSYAVVEAGIFGTMGRKAWRFALVERNEVVAMFPMYRKVENAGLTRYVPRVLPKNIRGSFVGVSMALESIADDHPIVTRLESASGKAVDLSNEIAALEEVIANDAEAAQASLEAPVEASQDACGSSASDSAGADADRTSVPQPEVVTLPDGSQLEVAEWEPMTAEEFTRLLGVSGEEMFGGPLVRVDSAGIPSDGNA